jgi:hypothetical protein
LKFTLYTSNCIGNAKNNIYSNKVEIESVDDLLTAVSYDHVCAEYKNNHRSVSNYIFSNVEVMDCDNDYSDDWLYLNDFEKIFIDVSFAVVPSRNHMKPKGSKAARPRCHIYFPHRPFYSSDECTTLKKRIYKYAPFFDANALDAARFIYGCNSNEVIWHEGSKTIEEFLDEKDFEEFDRSIRNIQEGSRNTTMSRIAGRLIKRYGNTEYAHQIYLEKSQLCKPPLEQGELNTIWNSAQHFYEKVSKQDGYIAPEEYNKPPQWETPIPFDEYNLPKFPVDTLPEAIGNYVSALSESTQTPVDMAAASAIAVMSVCMQGKFKIRAKPDWTEPVNTFVLTVMDPSERKSAVENAMIRPLNLYEAEQNLQNAGAIETSKMQKRILERRQKVLEEQAAKGKADADEVARIAEEIAGYKEMKPLKLYVDDITTEKLTSVLASNDGRAAILSTEGGIFDTLSGAYSKTVNIDVMLKGYSGDSIRVDRIGRNSESIMNPALTVLLMVQPSVLSGVMQNGTFRGRGLTARFLYSIPTSFVGKRKYRSTSVPDDVYFEYEKCIRNMLEDEYEGKAEIITLSQKADAMIEDFAETLEPELKKGYADIADWAGKLVGNILRISALICRASVYRSHDFLDVAESLEVDDEQMAKAIRIGNYFIEHAKAAFMLMGADPIIRQSKKIVEVIRDNRLVEFTRRDIMRLCRTFKKAEDVQQVLNRLIDYGYIAEKLDNSYSGKGRPPAQVYLVNPYIYEN